MTRIYSLTRKRDPILVNPWMYNSGQKYPNNICKSGLQLTKDELNEAMAIFLQTSPNWGHPRPPREPVVFMGENC